MGTMTKSGAKITSGTGTIGKSRGSEYRPPAQVIPPQVPSHYAPNYPVGHPRRQNSNTSTSGNERPGYSALPMPPSQQVAMHHPNPQLLHPLQHQQSHYDDRTSQTNMPRKELNI
jgi:abl interactor 2